MALLPDGDDYGPAMQLVHAETRRFPSGGNVYNLALLETAARQGIPLASLVIEAREVGHRLREPSGSFRIWDSLFLEELAEHAQCASQDWGLLLHYLPSLDLGLAAADRERLEAIERCVVQAAALVMTSGAVLGDVLRCRHPGRAFVACEPGVSSEFRPRSERTSSHPGVRMLTVANLLAGKGLLELCAPLAKLRSLRWRWDVIGDRNRDPDYAARLEAEVRRLGLQRRVKLHGALEAAAIARWMDRADLFLFPSRFESYGMALAEATAKGIPAVSMRTGAAERLVRHGVTGLLAPAGDVEAFAMQLRLLLESETLRRRFRDNLRHVEARTWEHTLADFLEATRCLRARARS